MHETSASFGQSAIKERPGLRGQINSIVARAEAIRDAMRSRHEQTFGQPPAVPQPIGDPAQAGPPPLSAVVDHLDNVISEISFLGDSYDNRL